MLQKRPSEDSEATESPLFERVLKHIFLGLAIPSPFPLHDGSKDSPSLIHELENLMSKEKLNKKNQEQWKEPKKKIQSYKRELRERRRIDDDFSREQENLRSKVIFLFDENLKMRREIGAQNEKRRHEDHQSVIDAGRHAMTRKGVCMRRKTRLLKRKGSWDLWDRVSRSSRNVMKRKENN